MKKVLIVVDYQNDFVDGSLGFPKAKELEPGIIARVEEYKKNGDVVVFTKDTHDTKYLTTREGKNLPIEHCIKGTPGHDGYGALKPLMTPANTALKNNFGHYNIYNFIATVLEKAGFLKEGDLFEEVVESFELCGIVTNICVISNAVLLQTHFPNNAIKINEKLCASNDQEAHDAAIKVMKGLGMEII